MTDDTEVGELLYVFSCSPLSALIYVNGKC